MKFDYRLRSRDDYNEENIRLLMQEAFEGELVEVVVLATRTNGEPFVFDKDCFSIRRGFSEPSALPFYIEKALARGFKCDVFVEEVW